MSAPTNKPTEPDPNFESPANFTKSFMNNPLMKVRVWLVVGGVLLILFFGLRLPTARAWVDEELQELKKKNLDLPQAYVEKAVLFEQWRAVLALGMGIVFIGLGIMLKGFPLPI